MKDKIANALCELRTPNLLAATAHSEPAQRIAQRIMRHESVIGNQYWPQMTKQDRQRTKRVSKMTAMLHLGERAGRW